MPIKKGALFAARRQTVCNTLAVSPAPHPKFWGALHCRPHRTYQAMPGRDRRRGQPMIDREAHLKHDMAVNQAKIDLVDNLNHNEAENPTKMGNM